jgi:hypothetical protein
VTIGVPADGATVQEGQLVTLNATAADPEDGDLAAQIAWISDVDGVLGTGGSVTDVGLSAGVHVITASVSDGDGGMGSDTITVNVDSIPVVTIDAPADGATFAAGATVNLSATATDAEEGDLTAQISWSSSVDGALGNGGGLAVDTLSAGTHTITASVTDAGGQTGSDQITVTITP